MLRKLKLLSVIILVSAIYCIILGIVFRSASSVPASVTADNGADVLILMYHSVLKDTSRTGKYIITPDNLRNDISYLKKNGYTFVSAQELIDYSYHGTPLPEKPVLLTFDDGHYNFFGYVMPILEETGANAVVSVVGSYTDEFSESNIKNMSYGYVRWSEVYDMFISNRVEVGNHSYNFHSTDKGRNGSKKKKSESLTDYERIFREDTEKVQNRCMTKTGFEPVIYTYPFGAYTAETTDWLKDMGFQMSLSCTEGINHITHDTDTLFLLKRYNRSGNVSTEQFFGKILN